MIPANAPAASIASAHAPPRPLPMRENKKPSGRIVDLCLQDKDFYETSGGGVTISGGEAMTQPGFLEELLLELKRRRLHVAIETTGYARPEVFQRLAPMFDLLLFDVKHYDSARHYEGTGVHNRQITDNLKWAIARDIEVLPRVPVIPGFNDSLEDAAGLALLLRSVGARTRSFSRSISLGKQIPQTLPEICLRTCTAAPRKRSGGIPTDISEP